MNFLFSGLSAANAEKKYIEICQKLDQYGVEFFLGKVGFSCHNISLQFNHII